MAITSDLAAANLVYRDQVTATAQTMGGLSGTNKLWLPLWSGEVINAYDQYNVFEPMISHRTISSGFAYEFPMTGTVALKAAWAAGEELGGGDAASITFKVQLDARPMAAHFETDNIDLLVTQWDYRSELARQAGLTLANTRDRQLAMAVVAGSALAPITDDPRGLGNTAFQAPWNVSTAGVAGDPASATETHCLKLLEGIEDYLVKCQENDVPVNSVYCIVTPKVFQTIRALGIPRTMTNNINLSTAPIFGASSDFGGVGAPLSQGMNMLTDSLDYMGVKIIKSNHLPKVNHGSSSIGAAKYNLNCSGLNLFGVIFQPEAVAGLSLQGMKVDTVEDVRRNTQFTVASMLKGTGVIRPEMCRAFVGAADLDTRTELRNWLNNGDLTTTTAGRLTNGFAAEYSNIAAASYGDPA
jgi:hypothetical protein